MTAAFIFGPVVFVLSVLLVYSLNRGSRVQGIPSYKELEPLFNEIEAHEQRKATYVVPYDVDNGLLADIVDAIRSSDIIISDNGLHAIFDFKDRRAFVWINNGPNHVNIKLRNPSQYSEYDEVQDMPHATKAVIWLELCRRIKLPE